jgi:hypothetical protein
MNSLGDKSFQKKKKCMGLSRTKSGMENILLLIDLTKKYFSVLNHYGLSYVYILFIKDHFLKNGKIKLKRSQTSSKA